MSKSRTHGITAPVENMFEPNVTDGRHKIMTVMNEGGIDAKWTLTMFAL